MTKPTTNSLVIPPILQQYRVRKEERDGVIHNVNVAMGLTAVTDHKDYHRGVLKTREQTKQLPEILADKRDLEALNEHELAKRKWERRKALLRRIDAGHEMTYNQLAPYRTLVAWRCIREMGRIKGTVEMDECLNEVLFDGPLLNSPWYNPMEVDLDHIAQKRHYGHYDEVLDMMMTADLLPNELQELARDFLTGTTAIRRGLALMPPEIPMAFSIKNAPVYNVKDDPRLNLYCHILHLIGTGLGMYQGCEEIPDLATFGLIHLTNPLMCRELFPSVQEIVDLETSLIAETTRLLQKHTLGYTKDELSRRYGLRPPEVSGVIRLTKNQLQDDTGSVEEEKAFMVLQIEDIGQRAKDLHDHRAELAAKKMIIGLKGLDRYKEDSEQDDFIHSIKVIELKRERKLLEEGEEAG